MPIQGLVRSPQKSRTIDTVTGRQLTGPYSLRAGSTPAATVGSLPGLTAPRLPACLADEARLKIAEPDFVWPLARPFAA